MVSYEDWFSDPLATLDALGDFLNLDVAYPFEDVRAAVEALIHPEANHAGDKGQKPKIPLVRHVYDMTRQVAGGESDGAQLRSFIEHFTAFRQLLTPFEKKLEQAIADERVQNSTTLAAALEAEKLAALDVVTTRDAATDGQRCLAASDAESHQRSALMAAEIAALRDLVARRDQALAEAHARAREQAGMRARAEDRLATARGIHARSIVKLHAISDASTEDGGRLIRDLLDELFPKDWYLDRNPDVRAADFPALAHYVGYGIVEGRHPHPLWSDDARRDD